MKLPPKNRQRGEISGSKTAQQGFTLVETLVAIAVLLVAMMGPMTIAARGLQSAFHAREQITAFYLAQEGVELIRQHRDKNALVAGNGWLDGIPGFCRNSNSGCGIDARRPSDFVNCNNNNTSCQLNYDSGPLSNARGFYTYQTGVFFPPSPFTRKMWIDPVPGGGEAQIIVEVSWLSGIFGATKTVRVQSRIFDQYDNI